MSHKWFHSSIYADTGTVFSARHLESVLKKGQKHNEEKEDKSLASNMKDILIFLVMEMVKVCAYFDR